MEISTGDPGLWIITAWIITATVSLVTILIAAVAWQLHKDVCEEKDFRELFVYQERVTEVLTPLAAELHEACCEEIRLQQEITTSRKPSAEIQHELTAASERVAAAKEAFWQAHRLARRMRFLTPKSYKELLSADQ